MSFGIGHRLGLDPMLLWLWLWPTAIALIRSLAWEHPNATGAALKRQKTKKKKKKKMEVSHFLISNLITKLLKSNLGTGIKTNIWTNGIEERCMVRSFFARLPKPFNGTKIIFK